MWMLLFGLVAFYCLFQAGPLVRMLSWAGYLAIWTIVGLLLWHVGAFEILWMSLSMIFGSIFQLFGVIFSVLFA